MPFVAGSIFAKKSSDAIKIAVRTFAITQERAGPTFLKIKGDALTHRWKERLLVNR